VSIVVTGGAGFIGSCIVRTLNDMGEDDIIIVDNINTSEKWINLRNKSYKEYIHKTDFLNRLPDLKGITHIIHMGACSSTMENDFDYLYFNNFEYSKALWKYCTEKQINFLYASSAATYGDGSLGFDDKMNIKQLLPLNRYGYSKQLFDLWVEKETDFPKQQVGMKFFNVYGPNEYAKAGMASVVYHGYQQVKESGKVKLFKSYKDEYEDGGQLRDFLYVKDLCNVFQYFIKNSSINGLFNIGTGHAESFKTLGESIFKALGIKSNIEYIAMPEALRSKYQYYTKANIEKLREVGYNNNFYNLEKGSEDYVTNYLDAGMRIY